MLFEAAGRPERLAYTSSATHSLEPILETPLTSIRILNTHFPKSSRDKERTPSHPGPVNKNSQVNVGTKRLILSRLLGMRSWSNIWKYAVAGQIRRRTLAYDGLTIVTNGRSRHQCMPAICQEEERVISLAKRARSNESAVRHTPLQYTVLYTFEHDLDLV